MKNIAAHILLPENIGLRSLAAFLTLAWFIFRVSMPVCAEDINAEAEAMVENSRKALEDFLKDPQMDGFRYHLKSAKGVLIIPELLKAGILVAGSGGNGIFLLRDETTDGWSYPYFYTMVSGSIGLQVGAKASVVFLLYMNQHVVDQMLSSTKFEIGGDATVSAGPKGGSRDLAISDILSYSRTKGLFGGVSVDGGMVQARPLYNKYYYGPEYTPEDILIRNKKENPQADPLREALEKAAHKKG
jgi:lipid-binding SYLF domain-containing protein